MRALIFIIFLGLTACQHQNSSSTSSPETYAATTAKTANLSISAAHANMKSVHTHKVKGMLHFTQNEPSALKIEMQFENLSPGPYSLKLAENGNCTVARRKIASKNLAASFMADNKGVVKTSLEVSNVLLIDMVGKTVILQTADKQSRSVACGQIQKI